MVVAVVVAADAVGKPTCNRKRIQNPAKSPGFFVFIFWMPPLESPFFLMPKKRRIAQRPLDDLISSQCSRNEGNLKVAYVGMCGTGFE